MKKLGCLWLGIGVGAAALGCGGDDVAAGGPVSLVEARAEEAGDNCASGGVGIAAGIDANSNAVLDDGEIDAVQYVCEGSSRETGTGDGAQGQPLVAFMDIDVGDSGCPQGGMMIMRGLDADHDGILGMNEVEQSTQVCSAAGDAPQLITTATIAPGDAACPAGGLSVSRGADGNGDGTLADDEVEGTSTVCTAEVPSTGLLCAFPAHWDETAARCVSQPDWAQADLSGRDLSNIYLAGADFADSTLNGADLSWAQLRGVDFSGADLTGVDLSHAVVDDADFTDAVLDGANLAGVDLRQADCTPDVVAFVEPPTARSGGAAPRIAAVPGGTSSGP